MKRRILNLIILTCILCAACSTQPEETTLPTETILPSTEQTTVPTTAPATEPVTEPTEPTHIHQFDEVWRLSDYDYARHQYRCSCEQYITEPHTFDENGTCTACEKNVRVAENGDYVVTTDDGEEYSTVIEQFYKPVEPGSDEFYLYQAFYYEYDGYMELIAYGTHGHITSMTHYDPDGNITMVETRTYDFDEQGGYDLDIFEDGELVEERSYLMGPDGILYETFFIRYGWSWKDGVLTDWVTNSEYEFDEAGRKIWHRSGADGVWCYEVYYAYDEAGKQYMSREIRYDENGQMFSDRCFDSLGNEIDSPTEE